MSADRNLPDHTDALALRRVVVSAAEEWVRLNGVALTANHAVAIPGRVPLNHNVVAALVRYATNGDPTHLRGSVFEKVRDDANLRLG